MVEYAEAKSSAGNLQPLVDSRWSTCDGCTQLIHRADSPTRSEIDGNFGPSDDAPQENVSVNLSIAGQGTNQGDERAAVYNERPEIDLMGTPLQDVIAVTKDSKVFTHGVGPM